jgi:hypothetical protein
MHGQGNRVRRWGIGGDGRADPCQRRDNYSGGGKPPRPDQRTVHFSIPEVHVTRKLAIRAIDIIASRGRIST